MSNNNAQLTPRGEFVADILTAVLFLVMGYAVVRATAVIVVRLGQFLGLV